MRFVRYKSKSEGPRFGWVLETPQGDWVGPLDGTPLENFRRLAVEKPITEVQLLPPLQPGKIMCIGRNYVAHAREHNAEVPEVPLLFLKPQTSVIGPLDEIVIPPQSSQVEHEAELVVVIGKRGRWIQPEDALNYVMGYTIGNDITARDLQRRDGQWTRAKGFDTFCPIGPWIKTDFEPADAMVTCYVNGEMRQMASTRDMVFTVQQLIAYSSSIMTLEPGDLLFTGTPAGVSPIRPGDIIEVTIEGLGSLKNPVIAEQAH
jgi:2-keto-4-pentenoate hydratase/2-oxohepta-3-ene-1,7-dioic acid hydratase in catechol pathway